MELPDRKVSLMVPDNRMFCMPKFISKKNTQRMTIFKNRDSLAPSQVPSRSNSRSRRRGKSRNKSRNSSQKSK